MFNFSNLVSQFSGRKYIANSTLINNELTNRERTLISNAIKLDSNEQLEIVYLNGNNWVSLDISQNTIVCITNQRIIKLEKGQITSQVDREEIKSIKHISNNVFGWDQLEITTSQQKIETFGIYYNDTCKYFYNYLKQNPVIGEQNSTITEPKSVINEKPIINEQNPIVSVDVHSFKIYVMELENGKYYVGKTKNFEIRIGQHFSNTGSVWTQKHHPIKVIEVIETNDDFDEDKITKKYMRLYGIDNVRGGAYVTIELSSNQKSLLEKELIHADNKCLGCGLIGHYIKQCPLNQTPSNCYKGNNHNHNHNQASSTMTETKSNAGTKWTVEEELQLLEEIDNDMSIANISIKHQRTNGAITARLNLIALRLYENGKSIEYIMNLTKLSKLQVESAIERKKYCPIFPPKINHMSQCLL